MFAAWSQFGRLNAMKIILLTVGLFSFASGGCARIPGFNPFPGPGAQAAAPSSPNLAWARKVDQLIFGNPDLEEQAEQTSQNVARQFLQFAHVWEWQVRPA